MINYISLKLNEIFVVVIYLLFSKYILCEERQISQLKFPVTLTLNII